MIIKPCVNGSSIEIQLDDKTPESEIKNTFIKWYAFLQMMCDIKEPVREKEPDDGMPSKRQYELMGYYKIPFNEKTTREEARILINESIKRFKAEVKKNNG